jgi:hypothetical protein
MMKMEEGVEIDVDVRTSGKVIQLERCPRLKNMELRVPGPPEDPDAITVFEVRSQCRRPRGHSGGASLRRDPHGGAG